jgi:hypothetical protein
MHLDAQGKASNCTIWRRPGVWLALILALSTALRLGVAFYYGDATPPGKDETSYSVLAARLAAGHGYSFPEYWYPFASSDTPTAHWSYLYTAFVAGLYAVFGVHPLAARLAGTVLTGLLLPWLLYRLACRVLGPCTPGEALAAGRPAAIALLTAALGAIYAYFVLYGAMVMTEGLYICALLWSLERGLALEQALHSRAEEGAPGKRSFLPTALTLGLSLGAAALLRQAILPWAAALFLYLLWAGYRSGRTAAALRALFTAGVIILLFILPFTVRNYRAYGEFLLLNSNTGYAMYSAQHPLHGVSFQAFAAAPLPDDLSPRPANEAQWERALMRRGIEFVIAEPVRYLRLSLSRVVDYFKFWPSAETTLLHNVGRVASFGLFLPFMLYGLWLSRTERRRYRLLYLFILFYSVLHILTWAMIRYRLPADAVLLLFAALAIDELWRRIGHIRPRAA